MIVEEACPWQGHVRPNVETTVPDQGKRPSHWLPAERPSQVIPQLLKQLDAT
jgi:hypothetical protein